MVKPKKNNPMTGTIFDPDRPVACRECGHQRTILGALQSDPFCPGCFSMCCAYCGCTEEKACVHPDHPDGSLCCSWSVQIPGACDFCEWKFAECLYYAVNGDKENLAKFKGERIPLITPAI